MPTTLVGEPRGPGRCRHQSHDKHGGRRGSENPADADTNRTTRRARLMRASLHAGDMAIASDARALYVAHETALTDSRRRFRDLELRDRTDARQRVTRAVQPPTLAVPARERILRIDRRHDHLAPAGQVQHRLDAIRA